MGKLRRFRFLFFYTAALLLLSVFPVSAGGQAPSAGKSGCVTAKCHSGMGKGKYVHGPVAAGGCVFCHRTEGRHRFKPIPRNVSELCYQCHGRTETVQPLHPPVRTSRCTACHSPHQSPNKYQLRGKQLHGNGACLWFCTFAMQP